MIEFDQVRAQATGRWLSIYRALGIDVPEDGKHGVCPICNKPSHFRIDDQDGRGTWICTCSAGDGFKLVQEVCGVDVKGSFKAVAEVVGNCEKVLPREKTQITPETLRRMFDAAKPYVDGDLVDLYLSGRGIAARPTQNIWYSPECWEPETKKNQRAMMGIFSMPNSKAVCIHRTYLDVEGNKLDIEKQKKITPALCKNISGGAIRLFDVEGLETMAVTEGIENALAVYQEMNTPCWACASAVLLSRWEPPAHIKNVVVVGDNDRSFTGQAAAYCLAKTLRLKYKKEVSVYIPVKPGTDFLDEIIP